MRAGFNRALSLDNAAHAWLASRFPKSLAAAEKTTTLIYQFVAAPIFSIVLGLLLGVLALTGIVDMVVFVSVTLAWALTVFGIARSGALKKLSVLSKLLTVILIAGMLGVGFQGFGAWALRKYEEQQAKQRQPQDSAVLQDIQRQLAELKGVSNADLKKRILDLSRQVMEFLNDREKHAPRTPDYDRSKPKEQLRAEFRQWGARSEAYSRETMTEYERRFGPEVRALVSEVKARGIDTNNVGASDSPFYINFDSDVRNPVNPIGVRNVARGLAMLAGKL